MQHNVGGHILRLPRKCFVSDIIRDELLRPSKAVDEITGNVTRVSVDMLARGWAECCDLLSVRCFLRSIPIPCIGILTATKGIGHAVTTYCSEVRSHHRSALSLHILHSRQMLELSKTVTLRAR